MAYTTPATVLFSFSARWVAVYPSSLQVNITNQFLKVDVLLADKRFVAILKQVASSVMSSIKADHITGQQSAHQGRQWSVASSEKKMGVIGHESPSVAGDPAFGQKKRKTLDQIVAILIASEYVASFYPPDDHMMQNTRGI